MNLDVIVYPLDYRQVRGLTVTQYTLDDLSYIHKTTFYEAMGGLKL